MDKAFEYPAPAESSSEPASADPGQLVVVRAAVVENADHVFGNLFQRMYASVGRVQNLDAEEGATLMASVREVEEALQLLLDYVAPFPPAFEAFSLTEVAQSLAQRFEECAGIGLTVHAAEASDAEVLADPARLGRAFDLLCVWIAAQGRGAQATLMLEGGTETVGLRVQFRVPVPRASIDDLRWAVAEKLVELQGGTLECTTGDGEGFWCKVSLPRHR